MTILKNLKAPAILSAYVTAVSLALTLILEKIAGMSVTQLFAFGATTGISETIGTKFFDFINKFIAFDVGSIVTLYVSVLAIVLVGNFLMGLGLGLPKGKTNWQKLALVLLYGTVPFYLLIVGFKWVTVSTAIGMAVWYVVVAISVGIVQKNIRL